jgi:hypothetical protein
VNPLQERPRSCRASGARPAGPLTRPHGKRSQARREGRPISRLQHLREPCRRTRRCSGATVGDSPRGPLRQQGKPHLKPAKSQGSTRLAQTRTGMAHTAVAPTANQGGPLKIPSNRLRFARGHTPPSGGLRPDSRESAYLEQAPPHSRVRTTLEQAPPRSRVLRTRTPVPVRGYEHLML